MWLPSDYFLVSSCRLFSRRTLELKDEAATSTNTGRSLRFPGHCLYTHTLTHQLHAEEISGEN